MGSLITNKVDCNSQDPLMAITFEEIMEFRSRMKCFCFFFCVLYFDFLIHNAHAY